MKINDIHKVPRKGTLVKSIRPTYYNKRKKKYSKVINF